MNTDVLRRHFDDCQLPVQFLDMNPRRQPLFALRPPEASAEFFFVDVAHRARPNEFFRLFTHELAELHLRDKRPESQHLVLQLRFKPPAETTPQIRNYLLGHDERQLFVVAPRAAQTVETALESLKPFEVIRAERRGMKVVRQGDWFFIRESDRFLPPPDAVLYHQERIGLRFTAQTGNPHVAEEQLMRLRPRIWHDSTGNLVNGGQNVQVWVRGAIRHPEHRTVKLQGWHFAVQNRVAQAANPTIGYWD